MNRLTFPFEGRKVRYYIINFLQTKFPRGDQNSLCSARTVTTSGQYSPVQPLRLANLHVYSYRLLLTVIRVMSRITWRGSWIRHYSWFSRDVRKTKIKNFRFLPLLSKSHFWTYICWPVFSSVDRFIVKIEHGFFTMRDIGVVSGQYVTCTKVSICLMFSSSE